MFIIAYILEGLAVVVNLGLTILYWLVLIQALISWVNPDPFNPIVQFLRRVTEPFLEPARKVMLPVTMRIGIDFSPLVVFFVIIFLQKSLVQVLFHAALMLK